MAATADAAALGGSKPNPSSSGPNFRPPGKPVALANITNTGRPNPPRSISVADVLKENAKVAHLLGEKNKIIEISSVEINKLRFALQATRQHNLIFAHTNSQILAELNQGKDRLKTLQHELGCATAMLKIKVSELEKNNNASNRLQKEATSEEINAAHPKLAAIEAYQADNEDTGANVHHLVESQSAVPSNCVHQEPPPDIINKRTSMSRRTNKQKSESCEGTKDMKIAQHIYRSHEDPRNSLRRRSARLNLGSSEMTDVSCETLHKPTVVPSASTLSVPELNEPNKGKATSKSMQDGFLCNATAGKVKDSELKQHPEPPQERANKRGTNKRKSESCEGQKDSNIEKAKVHSTFSESDNVETRKSLSRKSARLNLGSCEVTSVALETALEVVPFSSNLLTGQRKNKKQNDCRSSTEPVLTGQRKNKKQSDCRSSTEPSEEHAAGRLKSMQEDDIAASAPSDSSVLILEQGSKEKQNDPRSSMEPFGQQVTGRRSSMRSTGKAVSYKEIPLNAKMRRA